MVAREMKKVFPVQEWIGQLIGGYQIEELLVCGQLNAVYRARLQHGMHTVMITIFSIPAEPEEYAQFLERFQREADVLVKLSHSHILPIHVCGEQSGHPYMITPDVEGMPLSDPVEQGLWSVEQVEVFLEQLASALEYMHARGIVHRCLRPANLLIDEHGSVKVTGLGVMRTLEAVKPMAEGVLSIAGTPFGHPLYLAPEYTAGSQIDGRADVYAVGIILLEMLTGHRARNVQEKGAQTLLHSCMAQTNSALTLFQPDLSPALHAVIEKALARDPQARFQRVADLLEAFMHATIVSPEQSWAKREGTLVRDEPSEQMAQGECDEAIQAMAKIPLPTEVPGASEGPSLRPTVSLDELRGAPWFPSGASASPMFLREDVSAMASSRPGEIAGPHQESVHNLAVRPPLAVGPAPAEMIPPAFHSSMDQESSRIRLTAFIAISIEVTGGMLEAIGARLFRFFSHAKSQPMPPIPPLIGGFPALQGKFAPVGGTFHLPWPKSDAGTVVEGNGMARYDLLQSQHNCPFVA